MPLYIAGRVIRVTSTGSELVNTGSWVYEPGFLGASPRRSPYRPGFAAAISDGSSPTLTNLLDPAT